VQIAAIVLRMMTVASDVLTSTSECLAAYNMDVFIFGHYSKFWHLSGAEFSAAIDLSYFVTVSQKIW